MPEACPLTLRPGCWSRMRDSSEPALRDRRPGPPGRAAAFPISSGQVPGAAMGCQARGSWLVPFQLFAATYLGPRGRVQDRSNNCRPPSLGAVARGLERPQAVAERADS
jgi:hypothetical protein